MRQHHILGWLIAGLALLATTGCFRMEPHWLPDSSGVVYPQPVSGGNRLKHVDIETHRQRTIADLPGCYTSPVGVSPEGDRFAVVRRHSEGDLKRGRVVILGTDGRELHESASFPLGEGQGPPEVWDMISWSSHGNRMLIWLDPPVLYDVDTKKIEVLTGSRPSAFFYFYRLSPFVPDGSGVILEQGDADSDAQFVIRTWDGSVHRLEMADEAQKFREAVEEEKVEWWPPPGHWHGNVARLAFRDGYIEINADRRHIGFDPSESVARMWKNAESNQWATVAMFGEPTKRVVTKKDPKREHFYRIEYYSHPAMEPNLLVVNARSGYADQHHIPLYLSPNGKLIALKYRREKEDAIRLMVINVQGQIVHDEAM